MKHTILIAMLALALFACKKSDSPTEYVNESDYYKMSDVKMIWEQEDVDDFAPYQAYSTNIVVLFNNKAFAFSYFHGNQINDPKLVKFLKSFDFDVVDITSFDSVFNKYSFNSFPPVIPVGADTNVRVHNYTINRISWRQSNAEPLRRTIYCKNWTGSSKPFGIDSIVDNINIRSIKYFFEPTNN